MTINNKFNIGQTVYLITDKEQEERIVTAIFIYPSNRFIYQLSCGTITTEHYDFEISDIKEI